MSAVSVITGAAALTDLRITPIVVDCDVADREAVFFQTAGEGTVISERMRFAAEDHCFSAPFDDRFT